jgi:hypothetical protein
MSTLTITSESFNKLFGLRQKIENDRGISLSYHTGMILGKTSFYKEHVRWLTVSDKGELIVEKRLVGILKNKCSPEAGNAVVATITSAKECCKAIVVKHDGAGTEMHFLKAGRRIATATSKGTHDGLRVTFDTIDDLWIVLVLGWCGHQYVFMKAWEKTT